MNLRKVICFKTVLFFLMFQVSFMLCSAQPLEKKIFTHADTLRGTYGSGRDWWDVLKYELHVSFNISDSSIRGYNSIYFNTITRGEFMQIDLQEPLIVDSILIRTVRQAGSKKRQFYKRNGYAKKITDYIKDGNAYFIPYPFMHVGELMIYYHGNPRVATKPPWDGGLIWKKDINSNPFVSVACQALGASVWYPCKDHQADEPDQAEMFITCPDSLVCVGNGRMRNMKINGDGTATYNWYVSSPINNYNLVPYIGKYVHFGETYIGEKGKLDMDYWVLDYNLEKAKKQFTDAPKMMKAFEHWFGPYPFYEDGYKLVEAPHLGMEHQSAIAYGNGYQKGYKGTDLSGSGWGEKWDFIIVHESGHEWFANNISTKDIADMWVHESFTNYSETLFTDFYYGHDAGNAYVTGTRKNIENDVPVIGHYDVNNEGSGDMYYKGGNMIHIIRQLIDDDERFRKILREMNKTFYHQTVTTKQIEDYISKKSGLDLSTIFDQYLRTVQVPVLEFKTGKNIISYRWDSAVNGLNLPIKVFLGKPNGGEQWIRAGSQWQTLKPGKWYDGKTFVINKNFYIKEKRVE